MEREQDSDGRASVGTFRLILAAFDGSPASHRAVLAACALGSDVRGDVHVIIIVVPSRHAETPDERAEQVARESDQLVADVVDLGTKHHFDLSKTVHVIYDDDPSSAISQFASEHAFDLIVVGAHGRDHVTHRGIGRSLEHLLNHLTCPILVV